MFARTAEFDSGQKHTTKREKSTKPPEIIFFTAFNMFALTDLFGALLLLRGSESFRGSVFY